MKIPDIDFSAICRSVAAAKQHHFALSDKRMKFVGLAGALLIVLLPSCSESHKGVLNKEEMASLMADIHMGEAVIDFNYSDFPTDSSRMAFRQSIYSKHNVSADDVDSSFTWYGHHIEEYIKVYERTIEILEDRKVEYARAGNAQIAIAGDSVEVWTGPGHLSLNPNAPARMLSFDLRPDSTWQPGDIYMLSYKLINSQRPVKARLLVDYNNGNTSYTDEIARQNASNTLKMQLDSTLHAERVYGYISIPSDEVMTYEIDSIALTRMRRHLGRNQYFGSRHFSYGKPSDGRSSLKDDGYGDNPGVIHSDSLTGTPQNSATRGFSMPSHESHGARPSVRDLPSSSASEAHTTHRQGASEHKSSGRRLNSNLRRQPRKPQVPASQQPMKTVPRKN